MHSRTARLTLATTILISLGQGVAAQNLTLRADYRVSTRTHKPSAGFGASLGGVTDPGPVFAVLNVGADYLRRQNLGPGTVALSFDITIAPHRSSGGVMPFLGASASANWSGGEQTEWAGARAGFDAVTGFVFEAPIIPSAAWILEERFGRVHGREHMLTTRLGLIIPLALPESGGTSAPPTTVPILSSLFRRGGGKRGVRLEGVHRVRAFGGND